MLHCLRSYTMVNYKILININYQSENGFIYVECRQLDSLSETSLTSSGAPSTEDSTYVQGPVFGRRAERMMKASSMEWSDNSEDEYTVSVIINNLFIS